MPRCNGRFLRRHSPCQASNLAAIGATLNESRTRVGYATYVEEENSDHLASAGRRDGPARETYDVIANGDDPKITIDEMLETAKSVRRDPADTEREVPRDVIERIPENIKCISTFSIGFDHIDLEACKKRGIKVGNAPHGVTVATAEIAMLLLLGPARRAGEGEAMIRQRRWPVGSPCNLSVSASITRSSHLRLRQDRSGPRAARPRLRHGNPLLRHLPRKPEVEAKYNATYHDSLDSLSRSRSSFRSTRPRRPRRAVFQQGHDRKVAHGAIVVNTAPRRPSQ